MRIRVMPSADAVRARKRIHHRIRHRTGSAVIRTWAGGFGGWRLRADDQGANRIDLRPG
jgi:hypothetical protein